MEEDDPFWTHDTSHLRECSTSKHEVTRERAQTYSQSYSAGESASIGILYIQDKGNGRSRLCGPSPGVEGMYKTLKFTLVFVTIGKCS